MWELQRAKFVIDDGTQYEGWHDPRQRWNGWACPYFTKATTDTIVEWVNREDASDLRFHWDGDILVEEMLGAEEPDQWAEVGRMGPISMPGISEPLYTIGAYSWVWEEAEDDDAS